ncbi:MAG: hypothetical protein ABIL00_01250 [candidate division WOR-3 bacterium]
MKGEGKEFSEGFPSLFPNFLFSLLPSPFSESVVNFLWGYSLSGIFPF